MDTILQTAFEINFLLPENGCMLIQISKSNLTSPINSFNKPALVQIMA